MCAMQRSKFSVEEWLRSLPDGKKPSGESVEVRRVSDPAGSTINVFIGSDQFSSYRIDAYWAGTQPISNKGGAPTDVNWVTSYDIRIIAPSVVFNYGVYPGGMINRVYYAATDKDIAKARGNDPAALAVKRRSADERRARVVLIARQVMWLAGLGLSRAQIDLFMNASYSSSAMPAQLREIIDDDIAEHGPDMSDADAINHFVSLLGNQPNSIEDMRVRVDTNARRLYIARR